MNKRLEDKDVSINALENELSNLKLENDELRMRIQRFENLIAYNSYESNQNVISADFKKRYFDNDGNINSMIFKLEERIEYLEERSSLNNW